MGVYVYDLEQFSNFHSGVFYNVQTKDVKYFIIHKDKDDRNEYLSFLKNEVKGLVGFNNINYDYPLLHYLINNPNASPRDLYRESQKIIDTDYPAIPERDVLIPQLDLMRIWHFNNKAKMTSLKKLQFAMRWENVQDLPFHHSKEITPDLFDEVISYNLNDVLSTNKFYELSRSQIDLRKVLGNKFNINIINKPDPGIGEEILLDVVSKKLGMNKWDLKKMRSHRNYIDFNECILNYISFNSNIFSEFLQKLKNTKVTETKNAFKESIIYKGFKYDYGTGGIHGCIKPGVYVSDDNYDILDIDVTSFYPLLAIQNNFYPEHLGEQFCIAYNDLYKERPKYAKGTPENYGVKIALNGSYGKSNDQFSFLYDPKFTMQITINGQLLITMLCEQLVDNIEDITILQVNTDGVTVKVNKKYLSKVNEICNNWEKLTSLNLEYANYKKMVIRDVNNYLAIDDKNKVKQKGCFEVDKDWHKDHSMKAVRIALSEYFVNNTPIKDTLKNCHILDFCKSFSTTKGWQAEIHTIDGIKPVQKTNRYILANPGISSYGFFKRHEDGRLNAIEANQSVIILNKYSETFNNPEFKKKYLNYYYYMEECYKIINIVEDNQLTLF